MPCIRHKPTHQSSHRCLSSTHNSTAPSANNSKKMISKMDDTASAPATPGPQQQPHTAQGTATTASELGSSNNSDSSSSSSNSSDSIRNCIRSLHEASSAGDVAAVRELLSQGVAVNARDASGCTALIQAVLGRHIEVARLLLAHGTDANTKDLFGFAPLDHAILKSWHGAAAGMVQLLLDKGADIALCQLASSTNSLLTVAVKFGSVDVVKALLEAGAVSEMRLDGISDALDAACAANSPAIVQLLLKHMKQHTKEGLEFMLKKALRVCQYDVAAQLLRQLEHEQPDSTASMLPVPGTHNPAAASARLAVLKAWGSDSGDAARAAAAAQEKDIAGQLQGVRELLVGLEAGGLLESEKSEESHMASDDVGGSSNTNNSTSSSGRRLHMRFCMRAISTRAARMAQRLLAAARTPIAPLAVGAAVCLLWR